MQEIKTLATCNVTSNEESDAFDKEINALLADGWTVSASSITTTTGPVYTFASMVLVRDIMATEAAPVETPYKFKVGDAVYDVDFPLNTGFVVSIEPPDEMYDNRYWVSFNQNRPYFETELVRTNR